MKLLPLLAALLFLCCSDPAGTTGPGTALNPPLGLRAASIDSASIRIAWDSVAGVSSYEVVWVRSGTIDTVRTDAGGTGSTIGGLVPGEYSFMVRSSISGQRSAWASIRWAPAVRFTQDAQAPSVTLRMYEFASVSGSGLSFDPSTGGPRNAGVGWQWPPPVHLAILTTTAPFNEFQIGPAYAFLPFRNAGVFDSSSYIGRTLHSASSLDEHFLTIDIESDIDIAGSRAGNIASFTLPNEKPDGKGVVFLMRYGNGSQRHYARIFVRNVGGKLMQGTAPNRYVEVEVSWQSVAGLPYA